MFSHEEIFKSRSDNPQTETVNPQQTIDNFYAELDVCCFEETFEERPIYILNEKCILRWMRFPVTKLNCFHFVCCLDSYNSEKYFNFIIILGCRNEINAFSVRFRSLPQFLFFLLLPAQTLKFFLALHFSEEWRA